MQELYQVMQDGAQREWTAMQWPKRAQMVLEARRRFSMPTSTSHCMQAAQDE